MSAQPNFTQSQISKTSGITELISCSSSLNETLTQKYNHYLQHLPSAAVDGLRKEPEKKKKRT